MAEKASNKEWPRSTIGKRRQNAQTESGTATGIVRRIDDLGRVVTIVSMTTYGAFARIIPGIDGLIHISQIANKHVAKPQDELKIGQEVEAKITAIDLEQKRVSLSIRALLPEEEVAEEAVEEAAPVEESPAEAVEAPAEAVEAPAEAVEATAEEAVAEETAE